MGSVVAVTTSEPQSPTKVCRFVGLVTNRGGTGARAWFVVRNVVDGQGIEFMYDLYSPTIQKVFYFIPVVFIEALQQSSSFNQLN